LSAFGVAKTNGKFDQDKSENGVGCQAVVTKNSVETGSAIVGY
jgi:hypothetical protein